MQQKIMGSGGELTGRGGILLNPLECAYSVNVDKLWDSTLLSQSDIRKPL